MTNRLKRLAEAVERDLGRFIRDADPEVRATVGERPQRIAAWLRQREAELMMASPSAPFATRGQLARGLVAACEGNWDALETEPPQQSAHTRLREWFPRVASALALAALAFVLPAVLGIHSDDAIGLTLPLLAAAALALFGPSAALEQAGDTLRTLSSPK